MRINLVRKMAGYLSVLTPKQKARLNWHAEKGTPICVQGESYLFSTDSGAG